MTQSGTFTLKQLKVPAQVDYETHFKHFESKALQVKCNISPKWSNHHMWEMIQIVNSTKVWINAHISLLTEPYSTIWQISHYAVIVDSSSHTHSVSYLSVSPAAGRQQQQSQSWEPENRHASHPSRPAGHRLESARAFTQRKETVFEPKNRKLNLQPMKESAHFCWAHLGSSVWTCAAEVSL